MNQVLLLVVVGALALAVPGRRSAALPHGSWRIWLHSGLLAVLAGWIGALVLPLETREPLRPLLALVVSAAGFSAGTQLRLAYIMRAGPAFIGPQSLSAAVVGAVAAAVWLLSCLIAPNIGAPMMTWAPVVGALAMCTSQRAPASASAFAVSHRDVLFGHVARAGWWNLCAFAVAGGALWWALGGATSGDGWLAWLAPIVAGLIFGRLARRVASRDEAYVLLLGVLATLAGLALTFEAAPLLLGLLAGAIFINVTSARSMTFETVLEGLEQPLVIFTGLLAGLLLPTAGVQLVAIPLVVALVATRLAVRWWWHPTTTALGSRRERRCVGPGAAGVVLLGAAVAAAPEQGTALLVMAVSLLLWTGGNQIFEARQLRPVSGCAGAHAACGAIALAVLTLLWAATSRWLSGLAVG